MHVKKLAVLLSWEGKTNKKNPPWQFPLIFASLGEEPFLVAASVWV